MPSMKKSYLRKILIAEDDPVSLGLLKNLLETMAFEVLLAEDGRKAWELFQKNEIQMIITDWVMPGLTGLEIIRKVRESNIPSLPYIIIITSKGRKQDIVAGVGTGADDYLVKPFEPQELRARVKVGQRVIESQSALADRVKEVQHALSHIKNLEGILPICSYCHKIRDAKDSWHRLEAYIMNHSEAQFSHSLCPHCRKKHYSV